MGYAGYYDTGLPFPNEKICGKRPVLAMVSRCCVAARKEIRFAASADPLRDRAMSIRVSLFLDLVSFLARLTAEALSY